MWVAVLRLEIAIPGARSRKDRRQVVKSLKERIQSRFNVCCAEVGDLDTWTRATLGVTACANDRQLLQEMSDEIVRYAGNDAGAMLGSVDRDLFRYGSTEGAGPEDDEKPSASYADEADEEDEDDGE
ncbi:MAG: DUF503 domain-containing protein [Planctomycetota bacterium]|nr:DUF503 domain-containing protein [Planctomycetota bacterium]